MCKIMIEICFKNVAGKGTGTGADIFPMTHQHGDHHLCGAVFIPGKAAEPVQFDGVVPG